MMKLSSKQNTVYMQTTYGSEHEKEKEKKPLYHGYRFS